MKKKFFDKEQARQFSRYCYSLSAASFVGGVTVVGMPEKFPELSVLLKIVLFGTGILFGVIAHFIAKGE